MASQTPPIYTLPARLRPVNYISFRYANRALETTDYFEVQLFANIVIVYNMIGKRSIRRINTIPLAVFQPEYCQQTVQKPMIRNAFLNRFYPKLIYL